MMETITIPSPSVFLSSPVIKPAPEPPPPPPPAKRKASTSSKSANAAKIQGGVTKAKQSKSRNGCVTCKTKRLKCDETKPTCQQCHKRSVTCGGYKKDFKWRPFEETAVAYKTSAVPSKPKRSSFSGKRPSEAAPIASPASNGTASTPSADVEDGEFSMQDQDSFFNAAAASPSSCPPLNLNPQGFQLDSGSIFDMSTPPYLRELPRPRFEPDNITRSLGSLFDDVQLPPLTSPRPSFSGQSPRLIDLLLPGSDLNARPDPDSMLPLGLETPSANISPLITPSFHPPMLLAQESTLEDDIEEIIREPLMSEQDMWMPTRGSSFITRASTTSPTMGEGSFTFYRQPEVQAGSPEMLMLRFDKQTCGILSVKDGPTENPWRTLIWPLARDSPALYHAIASMTAFHTSKEKPALRVDGMEHMRSSIRSLATGIEKMRTDTALATTLVLAFSESWDQHISTGIEHLRGAKILVNQALIQHRKQALSGDDLARLKFLCNAWVYMDVIARLTSIEDETDDFDQTVEHLHTSIARSLGNNEIDPLMGCASTLFPLIGRAASLCRRVRKFERNSIQTISQAIELKEAIEQWQPPPCSSFERPEDPTSEIQHALQTAEAYRYATLLYLHQAVPEIPSLTSAQLAQKVLVFLATVPLSSRVVIVQIYPLLAAGCEAYEREDRQWVEERWQSMASRMWIGNVDRCCEVMHEVWARRDAHEAAKAAAENKRQRPGANLSMLHSESSKRKFEEELAMDEGFSFSDLLNERSNGSTPGDKRHRNSISGGFLSSVQSKRRLEPTTEEMDVEVTVRGRLHWVGVMKDWEWEILLG